MKMKSIFLLFFFSLTVFAVSVGEEVELTRYMNARYSAVFKGRINNLMGVLGRGARGKVIEVKKFISGNFGVYIEVLSDGPLYKQRVWIHFNPANPSLTLKTAAGEPHVKPSVADTVVTTREVPIVRDPATTPVDTTAKIAPVITQLPTVGAPKDVGSALPGLIAAINDANKSMATGADEVCAECRPGATGGGASSELYTPQQATEDILAEPLEFVGRGIPIPIYENGKEVTEGAAQYCVFKNSRVYVVQGGCRPNPNDTISVLSMQVFARAGKSVGFYMEDRGSYNLDLANGNFNGTVNVLTKNTPPTPDGNLTLRQFFQYFNQIDPIMPSCDYGTSFLRPNEPAKMSCSAELGDTSAWQESAANFVNTQFSGPRFRQAHDALKKIRSQK